jgi:tRNA A-37 threonylcarbamoyl transferase component Bud32
MSDYANDWVGQTLSGGRYRVDAKLGEGGMGFVYKVWDRNLDTEVVVKAPRKSMLDDPEFASRFALEIRSLVKLSHPNIVKVSDVGEHEGLTFAVMQYLSGGTLDERQEFGRDGRPKPALPSSVTGWLPGMAAALDFIHGKGYIHRDVKPANILFDTHGHPYLSDFGVAKVLSDVEASAKKGPSGMTGIGIVLGTPEYMAPELIMGNKFDGKVDQYALAASAYEILCGRKPFTGETATAILVRQTTQDPPPMVELAPSTAPAISRAILKGMAKKPGDRYGTCAEFASALVAALAKAGVAQPQTSRLNCPTCGAGFAATADLANYKGKKSRCRACGAPFRIAEDGLSLLRIDPDEMPTPSGTFDVAPSDPPIPTNKANRTVKLDAMPGPARVEKTMKMDAMPGPARVERTMKMDAMPNPARVERTMKMEAMPGPAHVERTMKMAAMPSIAVEPDDSLVLSDLEPESRSPLPWVIAGIAAVAATAILGIFLATRPSKEPTIELASTLAPSPPKVTPPKPKAPPTKPPTPAPEKPVIVPTSKPSDAVSPPAARPDPQPDPPAPPPRPMEVEKPAVSPPEKPDSEVEKHDAPPVRPLAKAGQAREHLTLRQIISEPGEHVDQLVFPSDLLLISTQVSATVMGAALEVRSADGEYHKFQKAGTEFEIVLKSELASRLRQELSSRVIVSGYYPALLKMRVEKVSGNNRFRGVVELLEFLYFVDARPLESRLLNKALFVVGVTEEGAGPRHSPFHKEWEVRLTPTQIIPKVRNLYIKEGRPLGYKDLAIKAGRPNFESAAFFHNWIKGYIHIK